ncbi:hypothetical protein DSO57_1037159 [Entomophthora muscae]|uniref:Uncharacterized protein n=1 Tax=Entomophthora muscae TaxID=34485 RepID=A0ACC2TM60_9FUNG|nr:hypothetical protein DSO57_1037159 [Entomophthora muscae]
MVVGETAGNSKPKIFMLQGKKTAVAPPGPWTKGLPARVFFGIKPLQAETPAKYQRQNTYTNLTMVAPKEEPLKLPNGGSNNTSVNFMSLKSSQVTKQTLLPRINPGFGPDPMTTAKN